MCSSRQGYQNQTHKQNNSLGAKDLTLRGGRGAAGKRGTVDKPKWEKLEEGAGDVQRVLGEEEEWEPPSPAVDGRFQGAAAGPLEGAPEGELKREYARLAGSSPPSPPGWLCQELEGGRPGRWAVGTDEMNCSYPSQKRTSFSRGFVGLVK
jgi:hypothetical protein